MKKTLPFLLASIISTCIHAQGQWTWMHGDSLSNTAGNFGTLGVSSATNNPPSVYEPCEWVDHDGKFWMLGGDSYNCLWKYDPVINEWTWMHGSSTPGQFGSYGVQGVSSPSNHPGGRQAATTWVDNDGNLWLFGGYGYPTSGFQNGLNDLWKYDIATNEWTWISGSTSGGQLGVYGTQGVPDPDNIPAARLETAAAWVDSANNLWFFGGQLCCTAFGYINDVWKFDIGTNEWTWMHGSSSSGALPVYGTKGIPDDGNTPGGRRVYSHWKDLNGNFWLSGGQDNFSNCFNDLWRYNSITNEWTWMSGSNTVNATGSYGTQCSFDSTNAPPARMENRFYWTDSCGNFWMFGGLNTNNGNYRNDLWCFDPTINQWKWMSGSSAPGQDGLYGTQGIASSSNHPGARYGGVGWLGPDESFYLFGGVGYPFNNNVGNMNDLWRFVPDSACVYCSLLNLPGSAFESSDTSVCQKFCINFSDQSSNNPTSWQWTFDGASPQSSSDQNPENICYNEPGTYNVTLITSNAFGSDTLTLIDFVIVYTTPAFPTITQNGYTLTSSFAESYQWQLNATDIPGATNQSYDVLQTGFYTVIVSDSNGCVNSTTLYVEITGIDEVNDANISIYPNPSSGSFTIELLNYSTGDAVTIQVVNTLGQIIFTDEEKIHDNTWSKEIDLCNEATSCVAEGIYFLEIKTGSNSVKKKIIITK